MYAKLRESCSLSIKIQDEMLWNISLGQSSYYIYLDVLVGHCSGNMAQLHISGILLVILNVPLLSVKLFV